LLGRAGITKLIVDRHSINDRAPAFNATLAVAPHETVTLEYFHCKHLIVTVGALEESTPHWLLFIAAEDIAEFAAVAPSFQLRIGSGQPGRDDRLHNAFYQPDERSIGLGVQALSRAALDLLA
jgi:metal-dependent amidase/aminoacylase/carboxypeptidase family protein